jgi:hypothetical protein
MGGGAQDNTVIYHRGPDGVPGPTPKVLLLYYEKTIVYSTMYVTAISARMEGTIVPGRTQQK